MALIRIYPPGCIDPTVPIRRISGAWALSDGLRERYIYCARGLGIPIAAYGAGEGFPLGSAHLAGMALDLGRGLPRRELAELRRLCLKCFDYVAPEYLTPYWVHAELIAQPLCGFYMYPFLESGMECGHVFALQTALNRRGFSVPLTARFTECTRRALSCAVPYCSGVVDASVWRALR